MMGRIEDEKYGRPIGTGDWVVGPDGVPVVIRLREDSFGSFLDGSDPGGDIFGVVIVLVGITVTVLGNLVYAVVRRRRGGHPYNLSIKVGPPEPRTLVIGFSRHKRAKEHAQRLIADIREHGAAAVPLTPEVR
ncbi:hypothetical protein [Kitasatospora sp. SUK 42]|uniref:hypothetical protein n=1 Tax=Kitasatospora sp. SUK 42 TaxID=1588882 RepID=UPI0018C94F00|nr:hypothetical protein [Kitasatospora sp. SUK 42]MBV2152737.1 hypothetical protein [Kitasatospora sp. SUK 42]